MAQQHKQTSLSNRAPLIFAILVTAICGLSCLPAAVLASLYGYYQAAHLIYPGVSVGELSLQGKTLQEASSELHRLWNMDKRIQVVDGLHTWSLSPAELGLSLDALQTARQAYEVGRGYTLPGNLGQMVYGMRNGWQVQPRLLSDPQQARKTLELLDQQARLPAVNPTLELVAGQVQVVPGKIGYELDVDAALQALQSDPGGVLLSGALRVPLRPLAPESIDYTLAQQQAQALLERPLTLHAYDPVADEHLEWSVPRENSRYLARPAPHQHWQRDRHLAPARFRVPGCPQQPDRTRALHR